MLFYGQLTASLLLDLVIGDPRWMPHPIRFIGWLCSRSEGVIRSRGPSIPERAGGVLCFLVVLGLTVAALGLLFALLGLLGPAAIAGGAILTLSCSLAAKDLVLHSRSVAAALAAGDLDGGRAAVALMVGRDTDALGAGEVARACIESVAENLVDGLTAPLFWAFVFALLAPAVGLESIVLAAFGAICYKAVNTMDSMIGYNNDRYRDFGRFAARFDDWCNFVPARVTGLCVVAGALVLGCDAQGAARVFISDRLNSSSPNSGHAEAAVAGALGIQLGGPARYGGTLSDKPRIGAGLSPPAAGDIERANRLVLVSGLIFFVAAMAIHLAGVKILA